MNVKITFVVLLFLFSHLVPEANVKNTRKKKNAINYHLRYKREAANDMKSRIQRDELYHHALARGLQILGPDPENDESINLELKDDYLADQGRVDKVESEDTKQKRDAQVELNDYGGDESANNEYNRQAEDENYYEREYPACRCKHTKANSKKLTILQSKLRKIENRMNRLEKLYLSHKLEFGERED